MLIYLSIILLILLLQNHLLGLPEGLFRDKIERRYLRIICYVLVLLAALRGSSVGADTIAYIEDYNNMPNLDFVDIMEKYAEYPGYYLLAKTCSILHLPIQILFGIVAGTFLFAIYKFINRFSEGKLYSILCFTTIGLYGFSLAGMKQTLSMAFILLFYIALTDKKYIKTIIFAIVAYYCHHASLIFLFGVALYFVRNFKLYYLYLSIIVIVSLFGTRFLWTNLLYLMEDEHYLIYLEDEGYSATTMIFYGVLVLFLFLFSNDYRKTQKTESRVMLGMSTLAFAFQALSFVSSTAFRLSYFFVPFMIVGFPNAFNCIENVDTKKAIKFVVAFMIVFFFFYSSRNSRGYVFFWQ